MGVVPTPKAARNSLLLGVTPLLIQGSPLATTLLGWLLQVGSGCGYAGTDICLLGDHALDAGDSVCLLFFFSPSRRSQPYRHLQGLSLPYVGVLRRIQGGGTVDVALSEPLEVLALDKKVWPWPLPSSVQAWLALEQALS